MQAYSDIREEKKGTFHYLVPAPETLAAGLKIPHSSSLIHRRKLPKSSQRGPPPHFCPRCHLQACVECNLIRIQLQRSVENGVSRLCGQKGNTRRSWNLMASANEASNVSISQFLNILGTSKFENGHAALRSTICSKIKRDQCCVFHFF